MASGRIRLKATIAPGTPPTGDVALYAKNDKKVYAMDDTGTETLLVEQSRPTAIIQGSTGTIQAGNAGIASCVRNAVGDYTVTLAAPTSNTLPIVSSSETGGSRVVAAAPGGAPPYSTVSVKAFNSTTGAAADSDFVITMVSFA
jgi:hypothetical protein